MATVIRGIANRNPANIKQGKSGLWLGSTGEDELGHAIFIDPIYSIRASVRQLYKYQVRDKLKTLDAIFAVYAPSNDPNANNQPANYARFVADRVHIRPDTPFAIFSDDGEVVKLDLLLAILKAMLEMECYAGFKLPIETLESGVSLYEKDFT